MIKIYDMLKKRIFKILPYASSILFGVLCYIISNRTENTISELLINLSATFFAIPLIYFFYEIAKKYSHKKLNSEIIDYAKMQIDRELLSIVNQLHKIVYSLENREFSNFTINLFLLLKKEEIQTQLKQNKYLGFQIFKHWEVSEKELHALLKNPFMLEKLEDDQIIAVINIIKSLRYLEMFVKLDMLYRETNEIASGFRIKSGTEMNSENSVFPDRYLLLKQLTENEYKVVDFGDLHKYNIAKCLKYFKVNEDFLVNYSEVILHLLNNINSWIASTGSEIIIDSKIFKIIPK